MTVDMRPARPGTSAPPSAWVGRPRLPGAVQPRSPSQSRSELTRWMSLADANTAGNVHGGTIMKLCDDVAGIAAIRHSGQKVVTAGMDRMTFVQPGLVGQLVTVRATVNAAWRTSMEVGVRVESENVRSGQRMHTSTAYLTMVAIDDDARPAPVPPIECERGGARRGERGARVRRATGGGGGEQLVGEGN